MLTLREAAAPGKSSKYGRLVKDWRRANFNIPESPRERTPHMEERSVKPVHSRNAVGIITIINNY